MTSSPIRSGAQVSIGEYAVLGDGRTAALVAPDGAIDWLCLPDLDATPTFARLLDAERGGSATLAPLDDGAAAERRYLPATNVLETTWRSAEAEISVCDALVGGPGEPATETLLVRRLRGITGRMRVGWRMDPRFGDGVDAPAGAERQSWGLGVRGDGPAVAITGPGAHWDGVGVCGEFDLVAGAEAVLTIGTAATPPDARQAGAALDATIAAWERWSAQLDCQGSWPDAVRRSALALRLLMRERTGAVAAAVTLGLPEQPCGPRNYDYRYCWLRDASFVVDAFGHLGDVDGADRYLAWLLQAMAQTGPGMQPFFRLDGGTRAPQREVELSGYGGARPVRIGNSAYEQTQIGNYGDVLQSCALHIGHGATLPSGMPERLAGALDHLIELWPQDDAGIWELDPPRPHTWSKMAVWVAFTRGAELAAAGQLPGDGSRWRSEAERVHEHIERHHFSTERNAYVAVAGDSGLDAAVLLGVFMGYEPDDDDRWPATLARLDEELGEGALLYRTTELRDQEQTFLPCAFWYAHALARLGRLEEARERLDALVPLANDVGLFSEEAAPDGTAWGNLPQALTHAAFINAAVTYDQRSHEMSTRATADKGAGEPG